jgi:hypothetical protein
MSLNVAVLPGQVLNHALTFIFKSYLCSNLFRLICCFQRILTGFTFFKTSASVPAKSGRLAEYVLCYMVVSLPAAGVRNRSVNVLMRVRMIFITPPQQ